MARYQVEFISKSLLRKTEVIVYIPTNSLQETIMQPDNFYSTHERKLPLMLLLSGFGSNQYTWERQSSIAELADKYKIAIAMIGGENKWYLNASPIDKWADFVNIELPDFLYGNFKMLSKDQPLYIGGCSMGGYGALRNYLLNLDKYKACAVLSPATRPDGNFEQICHAKSLKDIIMESKDQPKNIYLSVGTKDFIIKESHEFDDWLTQINAGFNYRFIEGYEHCFKLWDKEIEEFFKYIKNLK